jgi:hypothetical protein
MELSPLWEAAIYAATEELPNMAAPLYIFMQITLYTSLNCNKMDERMWTSFVWLRTENSSPPLFMNTAEIGLT